MTVRSPLRRRSSGSVAATFLLLAFVAAACGSTPSANPSTPGALGSDASPAGTPRRTLSNAKLADLIVRLDAASARQGGLVRDLSAATGGPPDRLAKAAADASAWASGESTWLDEHPADPCFRNASDAYRRAVTDIGAAAAELATLAASSNPPTNLQGQPAGAQLAKGVAEVGEASALAAVALRTCR